MEEKKVAKRNNNDQSLFTTCWRLNVVDMMLHNVIEAQKRTAAVFEATDVDLEIGKIQ